MRKKEKKKKAQREKTFRWPAIEAGHCPEQNPGGAYFPFKEGKSRSEGGENIWIGRGVREDVGKNPPVSGNPWGGKKSPSVERGRTSDETGKGKEGLGGGVSRAVRNGTILTKKKRNYPSGRKLERGKGSVRARKRRQGNVRQAKGGEASGFAPRGS